MVTWLRDLDFTENEQFCDHGYIDDLPKKFRTRLDDQEFINMKEKIEISLDPDELKDMMASWKFKKADELIKEMFERNYRSYVKEKDELVSKRLFDNNLLKMKESYEKKLSVRRIRDGEKRLCGNCNSRVKWDGNLEEYACSNCGWHGSSAIIEEN